MPSLSWIFLLDDIDRDGGLDVERDRLAGQLFDDHHSQGHRRILLHRPFLEKEERSHKYVSL